jgi:hypothetical protein
MEWNKKSKFWSEKNFFQFFLTIFDKIFKITPLYTVITIEIYIKIIFFYILFCSQFNSVQNNNIKIYASHIKKSRYFEFCQIWYFVGQLRLVAYSSIFYFFSKITKFYVYIYCFEGNFMLRNNLSSKINLDD